MLQSRRYISDLQAMRMLLMERASGHKNGSMLSFKLDVMRWTGRRLAASVPALAAVHQEEAAVTRELSEVGCVRVRLHVFVMHEYFVLVLCHV